MGLSGAVPLLAAVSTAFALVVGIFRSYFSDASVIPREAPVTWSVRTMPEDLRFSGQISDFTDRVTPNTSKKTSTSLR